MSVASDLRYIAVIDIGKTNAKLALVDLNGLIELDVVTRPNTVLAGPPWPHFDTENHWKFLLEGLRDFHRKHRIDGISITTHGACAALLDSEGGLAAPILDYEHNGPDELRSVYSGICPDFSETGSPRLAGGLNIGAQLHWQFTSDPNLLARTRTIVTYPQYWAHRLTGVPAIDVSSIGCHSDLWNPVKKTFSSLCKRLGIDKKLAPVLKSGTVLGPILPQISEFTGMSADTPVLCGIHDSNASLYPYIRARHEPFSVVSTGTWVVVLSVGHDGVHLKGDRDDLMNVDALGNPVPSARFMGGREYELIAGGNKIPPSSADANEVFAENLMLLPAVEPGSGPFQGQEGRWIPFEPAPTSGARMVALSYYLALVTAECLIITGAKGDAIIEGPFARNRYYCDMLQARTNRPVVSSATATGTSIGAAMLFVDESSHDLDTSSHTIDPDYLGKLQRYAERWQAALSEENAR